MSCIPGKPSPLRLALALSVLLVPLSFAESANGSRRLATAVDDTFEPYSADEWIISPDEEESGEIDEDMSDCDIYGVIACCDDDYLRIDILLCAGVVSWNDSFYAIRLEYDTMNEYYTYYPGIEKLVYEKEKGGKIVTRKEITKSDSSALAGVVSSGVLDDDDVYFIIRKSDHINGQKGKSYYLTCSCYSGYVEDGTSLEMVDRTISADVQFEY